VGIQVTGTPGRDLDGSYAVAPDACCVVVGFQVADNDGDTKAIAESCDSGFEQRRFSRARR
jgi:hypothetical protein